MVSRTGALDSQRCRDHRTAGRVGGWPAEPGILEVSQAAEATRVSVESQANLPGVQADEAASAQAGKETTTEAAPG